MIFHILEFLRKLRINYQHNGVRNIFNHETKHDFFSQALRWATESSYKPSVVNLLIYYGDGVGVNYDIIENIVRNDDIESLKLLLEINPDQDAWIPIADYAVQNGHIGTVRLLIAYGADLNLIRSPLILSELYSDAISGFDVLQKIEPKLPREIIENIMRQSNPVVCDFEIDQDPTQGNFLYDRTYNMPRIPSILDTGNSVTINQYNEMVNDTQLNEHGKRLRNSTECDSVEHGPTKQRRLL